MAGEMDKTNLVNLWDDAFGKLTAAELMGAGVGEAQAKDYIGKLERLHALQLDLMKPSAENRGMPAKLTEKNRKMLLKTYQEVLNATDYICGKQRVVQGSEAFDKKMLGLRKALFEDYGVMSDLADNKVELPLPAAVLGSRQRVITGDLSNAETTGANQSTRIATTVTDEMGRKRTGFFTEENVVDSPAKGQDATMPQQINKGYLNLEDGTRLDNRNSAMSSVAQLLGRGDLIAHSQNMELGTGENKKKGVFMEFAQGTDLNRVLPDDPYFKFDPQNPYTANAIKDMMDLSIIDYLCLNVDRHTGNIFFQYAPVDKSGNVTRLNHIVGIDNDSSFGTKNPSLTKNTIRLASLQETVVISETMARRIEDLNPETFASVLRSKELEEPAIAAAQERLSALKYMIRNGRDFSNVMNSEISELERQLDEGKKSGEIDQSVYQHAHDFLENPITYAQNNKIFGTDAKGNRKLGCVIVPNKNIGYIRPDAIGKNMVQRRSDGRSMVYGVFGGIRSEHSVSMKKRTLDDANDRLAEGKKAAKKSAALQIRSQTRQEFSNKTSAAADAFLTGAKMKNSKLRGTSREFESIRTTLKEISALSKRFAQEGYLPCDKEMNLMAEFNQRLSKECDAYLAGKDALAAQGQTHNAYTRGRIDVVKQIKSFAQSTRNTYRAMGDAENLLMGAKLGAQADEIKAFVGEMQPLDKKQAAAGDMKGLAQNLVSFSEKHRDNPNMKSVIDFYAEKLGEQIAEKGGFEKCGIDGKLLQNVQKVLGSQPEAEASLNEPQRVSGPAMGK